MQDISKRIISHWVDAINARNWEIRFSRNRIYNSFLDTAKFLSTPVHINDLVEVSSLLSDNEMRHGYVEWENMTQK